MGDFLVINAGSSSIKIAVFDAGLREVMAGRVSEIGGAARIEMAEISRAQDLPDHDAALAALLQALEACGHPVTGFAAASHRVVHGGGGLTAPCRITPATIAAIEACIPLAPLHNPGNLAAIRSLAAAIGRVHVQNLPESPFNGPCDPEPETFPKTLRCRQSNRFWPVLARGKEFLNDGVNLQWFINPELRLSLVHIADWAG